MAKNGGGGNYFDFIKAMALGGVFGFTGDAFTEVSKFPYLNDVAPIGGPQMSNYEIIAYGGGALMAALGYLDMITGAKLGGIGKELLPIGLGSMLGTNLYETQGAQKLGIRP
jgi:hypothetical protein